MEHSYSTYMGDEQHQLVALTVQTSRYYRSRFSELFPIPDQKTRSVHSKIQPKQPGEYAHINNRRRNINLRLAIRVQPFHRLLLSVIYSGRFFPFLIDSHTSFLDPLHWHFIFSNYISNTIIVLHTFDVDDGRG